MERVIRQLEQGNGLHVDRVSSNQTQPVSVRSRRISSTDFR